MIKKFSESGWNVIALSQDEADLSDGKAVRAKLAPLASQVDALIHCAGAFKFVPFAEVEEADYDQLMNSNLKSAVLIAREIIPAMKEKNYGRMIFIGSAATLRGPGSGMGLYAASKAGINMLVQSVADEVKKFDITVNALLPSVLDTAANRRDMPNADFTSWVKLEDLSQIAFDLTQASYGGVSGALIPVTGKV